MKIILGAWFTLPRLGTSSFSALMKQGVNYDRALGFRMDPATDVSAAIRTISDAIGEEVELSLRCLVCGREACPGCPYLGICDRTRVSSLCLCGDHSGVGAYEDYRKRVLENIAS